jgi:hypothetical protein
MLFGQSQDLPTGSAHTELYVFGDRPDVTVIALYRKFRSSDFRCHPPLGIYLGYWRRWSLLLARGRADNFADRVRKWRIKAYHRERRYSVHPRSIQYH